MFNRRFRNTQITDGRVTFTSYSTNNGRISYAAIFKGIGVILVIYCYGKYLIFCYRYYLRLIKKIKLQKSRKKSKILKKQPCFVALQSFKLHAEKLRRLRRIQFVANSSDFNNTGLKRLA